MYKTYVYTKTPYRNPKTQFPKHELVLGKHMLFVYSSVWHGQKGHTVECRVLTTLDIMFVTWESSIIMVVVMVFALTIVTVDCAQSLYSLRERMLWDVNDVSSLIISTKAVTEFDWRLQTNYKNMDDYEVAQKPTNPWEQSKKLNTIYVSIFATTCYEYFFDVLLEYIGIAIKLIVTPEGCDIDQKTIELIQFVNDDIYGLPTFLFDIGHRQVEVIFQMIHLLRSFSYSHQARLMKASVLREILQKFITDHSWKLTKPIEAPNTDIEELKNSCQDIKRKLTNISKIFYLKSKPLLNSHVFERVIGHNTVMSPILFKDYVYENEKCLVYVSIKKCISYYLFSNNSYVLIV